MCGAIVQAHVNTFWKLRAEDYVTIVVVATADIDGHRKQCKSPGRELYLELRRARLKMPLVCYRDPRQSALGKHTMMRLDNPFHLVASKDMGPLAVSSEQQMRLQEGTRGKIHMQSLG